MHTPGPWEARHFEKGHVAVAAAGMMPHAIVFNRSTSKREAIPLTAEDMANVAIMVNAPKLLASLTELLDICRWKCSPRDEVVLPGGKTNEQAMIEADSLLESIKSGSAAGEEADGTPARPEDAAEPVIIRCQNCGETGDEDDFTPTNGDPTPCLCPRCGSTDAFPMDANEP